MKSKHTEFYAKQVSLTEWLAAIGHDQSEAMRLEDNDKRERLAVLNRLIAVPYDKPYQFAANEVAERTPQFKAFLADHGDELCAIRLIPSDPSLPKLRMRGHAIKDAIIWFDEQTIDPALYRADFVPHSDQTLWATIFIVNKQGIFGELVAGPHSILTQGLYEDILPITFSYDFKSWVLSRDEPGALDHLKDMTKRLKVEDDAKRRELTKQLDASFSHSYLEGYFETSLPAESGLWFIDYNRMLGKMYADFGKAQHFNNAKALISGRPGSPGKVTGVVRIVHHENLATTTLKPNEILVCAMTTPDYVPLMQQAAAIVTDLGGILSHAAIVARELKKPCITGTKTATATLTDGMKVTVDADTGSVLLAK